MQKKENKEIELLNRLYQDCGVGMLAINKILKKLEKDDLKKVFKDQFEAYEKIADRCDGIALARDEEVKDNGMFKKMKQTVMLYMTLWMDKTPRHIVELMINGTVMGIIDTIKAENDLKPKSEEVKTLVADFKKMQNDFYEKLKKLLTKV